MFHPVRNILNIRHDEILLEIRVTKAKTLDFIQQELRVWDYEYPTHSTVYSLIGRRTRVIDGEIYYTMIPDSYMSLPSHALPTGY